MGPKIRQGTLLFISKCHNQWFSAEKFVKNVKYAKSIKSVCPLKMFLASKLGAREDDLGLRRQKLRLFGLASCMKSSLREKAQSGQLEEQKRLGAPQILPMTTLYSNPTQTALGSIAPNNAFMLVSLEI